jgi:hypothetical protein
MSEHDSPAMAIARVEVKANDIWAVEREQLKARPCALYWLG